MQGNNEQLQAFRSEVAGFLDTQVSDRIREAGRKTTSMFSPYEEALLFQQLLHKKGWAGV